MTDSHGTPDGGQMEIDMIAPGAERIAGGDHKLDVIADNIIFGEGPVWDRRGGQLFYTDICGDAIWHWSPQGGQESVLKPSSHANGMTLDLQGRLVVAGWGGRTVFRFEQDGLRTTLASHYDGKKLNSPNDIVVKSDGAIYFTDPPGGMLNPGMVGSDLQQYLDFQGVFRISPDGQELKLVNSEFVYPNGLCFSPDEKLMYVNCSRKRLIRVYDVTADGGLANGRVFVCYSDPTRGNPDGIKCDVEGNVYCTGPGGIWVHDTTGKVLARMKVPHPTNFAFGGDDWRSIYITTAGPLLRTRWNVPGVAAW